uniref:Uncharacterized protein n=1 Tax=Panagrolaimus sp. PS1159 TaxID=55785 RepID=A0AC35EXR4_9BILA
MPPSLNNDILKDICKRISYNEGFANVLKFALSGAGPLNAFMQLLTTVKSVEFKRDGVKAIFNWATYYLNLQSDYYSNGLCAKILSYSSELTIFVDELNSQHIDLLLGWTNKENLSKVCIEYHERRDKFIKPVMSFVLSTPIRHLVAHASSLIPSISTIKDKLFDSIEIRFENGFFDGLEDLLTAFRFRSKNLTLSLGAEYTWKEILYVVAKVVEQNDKGAVSTVVENLNLNFNGDIDVPALPELQLSKFFEDISKCFPMLKNVNFCIDFTSNARYLPTPTSAHFVALCEALTNGLGFHKIEKKESCWEVEKNISENKNFKMSVTLIQLSYDDLDMQQEILQDLFFDDEEYPSDYGANEDYDEYEDYDFDEDGDYAEYFGNE